MKSIIKEWSVCFSFKIHARNSVKWSGFGFLNGKNGYALTVWTPYSICNLNDVVCSFALFFSMSSYKELKEQNYVALDYWWSRVFYTVREYQFFPFKKTKSLPLTKNYVYQSTLFYSSWLFFVWDYSSWLFYSSLAKH